MTILNGRDAQSIPTYGARVCAKAQSLLLGLVLASTVAVPGGTLWAADAEPVNLGTAANFGALAGAAISGTGQVKGDVGSGTGAIAPAITSTGTIYPTGDAVVMTALTDLTAAYNEGKDRTPDVILSAAAHELGGTTLTPGVHKIGAAATMGSPVTFDAEGDPDAVFIIQVGAALSATAATGNVVLTNEAQAANIYWIVEGAVSMGANTHLEGNLLGGAAITFGAATTINGRVLAAAAAGTIALATTVTVPVDPSVVGDRVWFDANIDGIQDPAETTGFSNVPVSLLQLVLEKKTIELGMAAQFGALAGGAISGSGSVAGDVGSGTGAVAPAVTSTGTLYPTGHAVTVAALADFATAYNDGKNRTPDFILSAAAYELGGSTLTPGVYRIGAAATLASPVTLDAGGDAEAVFIIHIVGAFGTTAATGNVILANNAKSANVYWIVEGAVSVGAGTAMKGNILGGAAITFGASTTLSGRALAGTAAGTIAFATTVSAPTGTPPVGFPPPIVVANTVTDATGNYLFEGVQPGTYIVRWDLTDVPTDYRITAAKQGGDDALDSDSENGEVTGFVYSTEFEVLGGSTNLDVDLGLVETLPAIKTAAKDELATTLISYLLVNFYNAENWTALQTAKTDGDTAIDAATTPAGVAAAKAAALAAMDAVPTVAETLAEAKVDALADLATARATFIQANYTAENWTTLTTANTNGEIAIQAATDLAGVATAMDAALAAMDVVPTIAETLAAAKVTALADLDTVLATYLETNYTAEGWIALNTVHTNGQIAINAATDLTGVAAAVDTTLAALDAVPTFAETMATAKAAALNDLTMALADYLEANYYTPENWTALIDARAAGNLAIHAATDPAGVAAARDAALAAMDAVPTYAETLAAAKALALNDLATALATYLEENYTVENWVALNIAKTNGELAINAATDLAGVAAANAAALAAMDAVPTIAETLAAAKAAALEDLAATLATYLEANYYTPENWVALNTAKTNGEIEIDAATDLAGVAAAVDAALAAMEAVPADLSAVSIGSVVWNDLNNNGLQDSGEPGITGALVSLFVDDGAGNFIPATNLNAAPVSSQTPGSGGIYFFSNLPPGDYRVQVVPPAGFQPSAVQTAAGNDNTENDSNIAGPGAVIGSYLSGIFTLAPGELPIESALYPGDAIDNAADTNGNMTIDFGFFQLGSITGTVQADTTGDGLGDTPLVGVTLTLFDENNEPMATTTTNGSGVYSFLDLAPGDYTVVHTLPSGYTAVTPVSVTGSVLIGLATTINFVDDAPTCVVWEQNYIDTDGDVFPLIQEYAFGGDPTKGDHLVANTARRAGLVLTKNLTGGLDVTVVRPAGREDVTYTLVGSADLVLWTELTALPTVTDNGDSTDTLTWANVQTLAPMSSERGFVRLKVETSCNPGGSYTLAQGWSEETVGGSRQTHGLNFSSLPVYTSRVDSITGAAVVLQTSANGVDLSSFLVAPDSYYLEFTDGPAEGHRFDIASGAVAALTLNLGSAHNTLGTVPAGVESSHFVIRKHITLAEVYPPALYRRSSTVGSADQVQFYNGTGFDTYFSFSAGYWVKQGAGIGNRNNLVIAPGVAAYVVHPNSADSHVIQQLGEVRYNDFIRPLPLGSTGLSFVAQGYPLNATPYGLDMTVANGFTAASSVGSADIIQNWIGDTTVNAAGYTTNFLLSGGTWRTQGNITNNTSVSFLFTHSRGVFVGVKVNKLDWTHSLPWNPLPWEQPVE